MSNGQIIITVFGSIFIVAVIAALIALMIRGLRPPNRTEEEKCKAKTAGKLKAKLNFIKALICIGVFLAANITEVLLMYAIYGGYVFGAFGFIPKAGFWSAAFFIQRKLCRKYEHNFREKHIEISEYEDL